MKDESLDTKSDHKDVLTFKQCTFPVFYPRKVLSFLNNVLLNKISTLKQAVYNVIPNETWLSLTKLKILQNLQIQSYNYKKI